MGLLCTHFDVRRRRESAFCSAGRPIEKCLHAIQAGALVVKVAGHYRIEVALGKAFREINRVLPPLFRRVLADEELGGIMRVID